jgi:hypothetical protein
MYAGANAYNIGPMCCICFDFIGRAEPEPGTDRYAYDEEKVWKCPNCGQMWDMCLRCGPQEGCPCTPPSTHHLHGHA